MRKGFKVLIFLISFSFLFSFTPSEAKAASNLGERGQNPGLGERKTKEEKEKEEKERQEKERKEKEERERIEEEKRKEEQRRKEAEEQKEKQKEEINKILKNNREEEENRREEERKRAEEEEIKRKEEEERLAEEAKRVEEQKVIEEQRLKEEREKIDNAIKNLEKEESVDNNLNKIIDSQSRFLSEKDSRIDDFISGRNYFIPLRVYNKLIINNDDLYTKHFKMQDPVIASFSNMMQKIIGQDIYGDRTPYHLLSPILKKDIKETQLITRAEMSHALYTIFKKDVERNSPKDFLDTIDTPYSKFISKVSPKIIMPASKLEFSPWTPVSWGDVVNILNSIEREVGSDKNRVNVIEVKRFKSLNLKYLKPRIQDEIPKRFAVYILTKIRIFKEVCLCGK